jgi:hypothetical protein
MAAKTDIELGRSVSRGEDIKLGDVEAEMVTPEESKRLVRKMDKWYAFHSWRYTKRQS